MFIKDVGNSIDLYCVALDLHHCRKMALTGMPQGIDGGSGSNRQRRRGGKSRRWIFVHGSLNFLFVCLLVKKSL